MCAIFSSCDYNRFQYLYKENLGRGNFAHGFAFRDKITSSFTIIKSPGVANFNDKDIEKYDYFIGHTQAPTSSIREFNPETSHPFNYKNLWVSHNGVLTNDVQLKSSIPKNKESSYNEVDSSVIPILIDEHKNNSDISTAILHTLSKLQGTYSVWVIQNRDKYNTGVSQIYFARAGSTLFMNRATREISSVKLPEVHEEVVEGLLYRIGPAIHQVPGGKFKSNSPFFIL